MRDYDMSSEELARLVDRHIELSEVFAAARPDSRGGPRRLIVPSREGAGLDDCLAGLVDRALVAYEGTGFAQDSTILALKLALAQAIEAEAAQ